MSPLLDLILTIAGFVVLLPGIALVMVMGLHAGMMSDGMASNSRSIEGYLVGAAVIVLPLTVIAVYIGGIVCAWRAAGLTLYYPWVTLGIGVAGWFVVAWIITRWFEHASRRRYPPRDFTRQHAMAGTVHVMTAAEIAAELDGAVLDDRLWHVRMALTPQTTPRRKRGIPRAGFRGKRRVFVVHAELGLPGGWTIERSQITAGFGMPGGGIQYVFLTPDPKAGFQPLIDRGFLEEIHRR